MSKGFSRFSAALLSLFFVFSLFSVSASAKSVTTQEWYWDGISDEMVPMEEVDLQSPVVDETQKNEEVKTNNSNYNGSYSVVRPQWVYKTFVRYDQSSAYVNRTEKLVDRVSMYNGGNHPTTLTYKVGYSGTFTASNSYNGSTSVEMSSIVAKVDATVSVGGTNSRSWTKDTSYQAQMTIDPGYSGQIDGYIPGTSSNGQLVHKVTDDGSGQYWYEYTPVGAMVPAETSWHFVTSTWKGV